MESSVHPKPAGHSVILKMIPEWFRVTGIVFFGMVLMSCTSTHWEAVHPHIRPIHSNEVMGVPLLGEAFILTRPTWFASQLGIPSDSVHERLSKLTDSLFLGTLSESGSAIEPLASSTRNTFSRETQKLDEKIYLKVQFPPQGVIVSGLSAPPDYLLIVHEYTLGIDLKREAFYDYRLANQETAPNKQLENLSIIASFTLWDNRKQIPLYSGISEVQLPLRNEKLDMTQYRAAVVESAKRCLELIKEAS